MKLIRFCEYGNSSKGFVVTKQNIGRWDSHNKY